MLLVPALLGAALLGRLGVVVAGVALVAVGGNRFGADGGGLLVLLAGYGVLVRLRGVRLDRRAGRAIAAGGGVARGRRARRSRRCRSAARATSRTPSATGPARVLGDIADRLELSARRTFEAGRAGVRRRWRSLAVAVVVATRRPRAPVTDALLAALLVSLIVNDTPGDVLGVGAAAAFVVRRCEIGSARDVRRTWIDCARCAARPRLSPLLLAVLALGCRRAADGEEVEATPETVVGERPRADDDRGERGSPGARAHGRRDRGRRRCSRAQGCGACHTLVGGRRDRHVGPNLDEAKPSYELVVQRVTLGQGGMPKFGDQLEPQQIADVAAVRRRVDGRLTPP